MRYWINPAKITTFPPFLLHSSSFLSLLGSAYTASLNCFETFTNACITMTNNPDIFFATASLKCGTFCAYRLSVEGEPERGIKSSSSIIYASDRVKEGDSTEILASQR